ncbi:MAG TPA: hypothetical protein GXZ43_05485 [Clostridiaceae bacterium]|nr:hypothetical protein [Clostridiaceae bacterium]
MKKQYFANTGNCVQFILRQYKFLLLIFVLSILAFTIFSAQSYLELYPDAIERQLIAETMKNPSLVAMLGPVYGSENYTIGAVLSNQSLLITIVVVAIFNVLFVVKHLDYNENMSISELFNSFPIGRSAKLLALIIIIFILNFLLILGLVIGLLVLGIDSIDFNGSILYGSILALSGFFFGSLTMVISQLFSNKRLVMGLSFGYIGFSYLLRAVGDIQNNVVSYLSPIGLLQKSQVFVKNYWYSCIIILVITIILILLALFLSKEKDLGSGLIKLNGFVKRKNIIIKSPVGLALQIQKSTLIVWLIVMIILGFSYGSIVGDLGVYLEDNNFLRDFFVNSGDSSIELEYTFVVIKLMAILGIVPALLSIIGIWREEKSFRLEHIIAKPISRLKLFYSFTIPSCIFSLLNQLCFAGGYWYSANEYISSTISLSDFMVAVMSYFPAILFFISLSLLFIGIKPNLLIVNWLIYGVFSFLTIFGQALGWSEDVLNISIFNQIARYPVEDFNFQNMYIILSCAIIFNVIGFLFYRKRDLFNQ